MKHLSFLSPLLLMAALLTLSLLPTQKVLAATITVDSDVQEVPFVANGNCTLGEAIEAANTDSAEDGCIAGAGGDTIVLQNTTYTLTQVGDVLNGANGLPVVIGFLTIEGNGATIIRDSGAPTFRIFQTLNFTNLTLDSLTISGGNATGGSAISNNGGAILNDGTLTITNSTFTDNFASNAGGAIYVSGGTSIVTNSTFNGNISNNSATSGGGAITNTSGASMTLTNVTIAANLGNNGGAGGINNISGSVTLRNTIVAQNTGIANCAGTVTNGGSNLIFPALSCGALPSGDPLLSTGLANNGGLTQTMLPATGSPAIDGVAAGCPPPSTDQRGFARPLGTNCDIGSVEVGTTLIASAACNGNDLEVTITAGDGPFDITGTGPDLPNNGVNVGITPLTGPDTWTGVTVTETSGDGESINLPDFTCPATIDLDASATCFGNDLEVTIIAGDGPFDITGASGNDLPTNGVNVGATILNGPGTWTGLSVTETGGNTETLPLGIFTCPPPITLVASAICNGANLEVTISAGDDPFNITGTGPGLPNNGVNFGLIPLAGPGMWDDVMVTETSGDGESTVLGDFTCNAIPLDAFLACIGPNLDVTIADGDGPFDISGAGPGLPAFGVNASTTQLPGPASWQGISVEETTGDGETLLLGDIDCPPTIPLLATAACNGANLEVTITQGDGPFDITGGGAGLPNNGVNTGTHLFPGPGMWDDVTVMETSGNGQSLILGDFTCVPSPLAASAACVGNDLVVTITTGDGPFDITGAGAGLPASGVGAVATTLPGPDAWTLVQVEETSGDGETLLLGDFTCPIVVNIPLAASAACVGNDLVVTITTGDGPFDITGAGAGLPASGVGAVATTLPGPDAWTLVQVEETSGDGETLLLGDFTCPIVVNIPLAASAACVGNDLVVTITTGDGPFDITGAGAGLPASGVGAVATTLPGPDAWTLVQVEETGGDGETLLLGDFTCPIVVNIPLAASAACVGNDLVVTITTGDGPFDITGAGAGLPASGVGAVATTLPGPDAWTLVQVEETGGDGETLLLGDFTCPIVVNIPLAASAACVGNDLVVTITTGDGPFDITGAGAGLPASGVGAVATTLPGPDAWTLVQVEETSGDGETLLLGDFTCPIVVNIPLAASAACVGNDLVVTITTGDGPFDITGAGAGLPASGVGAVATTLPGPDAWTLVQVEETSGDGETLLLGDFTCPIVVNIPLAASAACVGNDLVVTITTGDGPFDITGAGAGLPASGVGAVATTLPGPDAWTLVQVEETSGDGETLLLGDFTCPIVVNIPLAASAACVGNDLVVTITTGDGPFDITGAGAGLPASGVGAVATTLPGPGMWTAVTVTETGGDGETLVFGAFTCPIVVNTPLVASAACVGNNLQVTITAGDGPFNILGTGPGLPANGVNVGMTPFTGPAAWTGVTVTETSGDLQSSTLGNFNCIAGTTPLAATAACSGNNLQISITAGDGPFNIAGAGNGLPNNGVGIGTTFYGGAGTWTGVSVRETTGNLQVLNLGSFTCPTSSTNPTITPTPGPTATPIPPPPPPLCADIDGSTNAIIRADVSAGTVTGGDVYCRVITQNGQFIQVPAEIGIRAVIDLGVIHAVDVFGLRPNNESAPDFNNPVQVCLQGSGHLVYLNALHAPRFAVVLTGTTSAEGYTCGNIPDAGTVVLTTNGGGLPTAPSASGQGGGGPFSVLGGCVITTLRRVNLRSGPAFDMPILRIVPEGVTLSATGRSGRWLLTNYSGIQGWVRAGYVSSIGTCG